MKERSRGRENWGRSLSSRNSHENENENRSKKKKTIARDMACNNVRFLELAPWHYPIPVIPIPALEFKTTCRCPTLLHPPEPPVGLTPVNVNATGGLWASTLFTNTAACAVTLKATPCTVIPLLTVLLYCVLYAILPWYALYTILLYYVIHHHHCICYTLHMFYILLALVTFWAAILLC